METPDLLRAYPTLAQFLGAYFHRDWTLLEADCANAVIEKYLARDGRKTAKATNAEITQLLAQPLNDKALSAVLWKLGSYYCTQADGLSAREWLERIHKRLESHFQ